MQFDFLPHSKLNLLSLLLPKKYAMFLCPQLKSQQKEIRMCICAFGSVCVCMWRFQTISRWNLLQIAATMGNLHKISICVFVIQTWFSFRFRLHFAKWFA